MVTEDTTHAFVCQWMVSICSIIFSILKYTLSNWQLFKFHAIFKYFTRIDKDFYSVQKYKDYHNWLDYATHENNVKLALSTIVARSWTISKIQRSPSFWGQENSKAMLKKEKKSINYLIKQEKKINLHHLFLVWSYYNVVD